MPPIIALLAATVFVWWVFRKDAVNHPYPSGVLWLPTLWMMRCGSRSVDAWFGGGELGRLDPVVISILIVAAIIVLARRGADVSVLLANNLAILVFCGYLFLSTTWAGVSGNPAIKIMRPLGDLLMALVVVTEPKPLTAIATIFRRTAILLIPMSIVLIRYYPALGRGMDKHWGSDPWIGVTTHKNPLGQLCFAASLAFFWLLIEVKRKGYVLKQQRVAWVYLSMLLYLFYGGGNENSQSSTAIMCLMISVALFLIMGRFRSRPKIVLRAIIGGVVCLGAVALLLNIFGTSLQAVVAGLQGKDATLSDRTYLWADVVRLGMENPILGSGYGGFWVADLYEKLSPEVNNEPAQAHNGYLEVFANLGIIGVLLLFVVLFQSIVNAARTIRWDFDYGRIRLVLICTVIIMNYSEASFSRGTHLWWFGFLVFALHPTQPRKCAPADSDALDNWSYTGSGSLPAMDNSGRDTQ
jgi:exopolysaccharide production protein ExoQ